MNYGVESLEMTEILTRKVWKPYIFCFQGITLGKNNNEWQTLFVEYIPQELFR